MKTKAAVLRKIGEPLEIVELTIPKLKPHQVLVDIAYSGICGSQILEIEGGRRPDPYLPHTLGHEGSGVVVKVGADVEKVKSGNHVVLSWIKSLGVHMTSCTYDLGKVNSGAISTFMTKAVMSETCVTRIFDEMPLREAALLGCAFPTGFGAVCNTAKVEAGSSVAIFGLGGVGLSAVIGAVFAKAYTIIVIDIDIKRIRIAKELGAIYGFLAQDKRLENIIRDVSLDGTDFSIEATGNRKVMEAAVRITKSKGLCVLAGNLPRGQKISIDPFDLIRGKRIIGTWGGGIWPDRDIAYFIGLYLNGQIPLGKLIGREYPLEKINEALTASKTNVGRTLINMRA